MYTGHCLCLLLCWCVPELVSFPGYCEQRSSEAGLWVSLWCWFQEWYSWVIWQCFSLPFFFFLNFHIDFHNGFSGFTVPPAMNKYSYFPTSSPVFVSSVFWLTATLTGVRGNLKATLICISLMIRMDAFSSICWLSVFLRQRTADSVHFLQFVFWLTRWPFWKFNFCCSLCILDSSALSDAWSVKNFPSPWAVLVTVSSVCRNSLILCNPTHQFFLWVLKFHSENIQVLSYSPLTMSMTHILY